MQESCLNHSIGYYAATFCLIVPLEGCEVPGNEVDWDSMNYAAAACGEANDQCKASNVDMNVAAMHHANHK